MQCANICSDALAKNEITLKHNFHWIWIVMEGMNQQMNFTAI